MVCGVDSWSATLRFVSSLLGAATLLAAFIASAGASEIYRWIGADGVVHYSDEKPEHESFATLEIAEAEPKEYDPRTDHYSILNQARRLNATWIELSRAREERQRRRHETLEQNEVVVQRYDPHYYRPYQPYFAARYFDAGTVLTRPDPQRQLQGLQDLDLVAPRAYSINSSAHRARVQRSQALPVVPHVR